LPRQNSTTGGKRWTERAWPSLTFGGHGHPGPSQGGHRAGALHHVCCGKRVGTDPDEITLRGFGKQLGSSKKEIIALSKDLAVGQPADVAMEATRLAGEACDAIKACRKSIRAALRELSAASDISEASGPIRARPQQQGKPATGRLEPGWAAGTQPAASTWSQTPPPPGVGSGGPGGRPYVVSAPSSPKDGRRECRTKVAANAHAGRLSMAPPRGSSA
jgi:hypothetical protein